MKRKRVVAVLLGIVGALAIDVTVAEATHCRLVSGYWLCGPTRLAVTVQTDGFGGDIGVATDAGIVFEHNEPVPQ